MNFSFTSLDKLTRGDNQAKKTFVDLFISEMRSKELPLLSQAAEEKNLSALKSRAHSIKSNVRFFGMLDMVERLENLENLSSITVSDDILEEVHSISNSIKKTCDLMQDWSENFVLTS